MMNILATHYQTPLASTDIHEYGHNGVPNYWYNIVPYIENDLRLKIPPLLDPNTFSPIDLNTLSAILPRALAQQELNFGDYQSNSYIKIPDAIYKLYSDYRVTPLVRAHSLEKYLELKTVKLYFKREDKNRIGSYKLNSSYVQAYYAKEEGVSEFIGDTGPGNWGMGMAVACNDFNIPASIYMDESNYNLRRHKVKIMESFGAKVIPVKTATGTIAGSISIALEHIRRTPKSKLCLGCLTAYSALHNTVIGMELKSQLKELDIQPDAFIGVVGGGSSFSGFVFPLIPDYKDNSKFIAVESTSVPSFSRGEYVYENPDLIGLMPRAKMFTVGNQFVPKGLKASGLNYHGKNPLLSLLVNEKIIDVMAIEESDAIKVQKKFAELEGILPAAESCYAIEATIELAKKWDGEDKSIVFLLTGSENSLES